MSLSPEAKALLESTRSVHEPTPADESRVLVALSVRLMAPPTPVPPLRPAWTPRVIGGGLKVVLPVVLVLGLGWLGLTQFGGPSAPWVAAPSPPPSLPEPSAGPVAPSPPALVGEPSPPPATRPSVSPAPPPPGGEARARTRPPAPAASIIEVDSADRPPVHPVGASDVNASVAARKRRPEPPTSGGLAEELRLLEEARDALAAGRAESSLAVLRVYQQRFPEGALFEEGASLKVRGLCAAGQSKEAEERRREFVRRWPNSSHTPSACASP